MTLKLTGASGMTAATSAAMALAVATGWDDFESIVRAQVPLLRCVVGNPFRPVAFASIWQTSTVIEIADSIYADRAFDRMPILSDALDTTFSESWSKQCRYEISGANSLRSL